MDTLKKIVDGIGELITDTVMTEQEGSRRCLNSEDLNNLTEWMDLIDDVRKGNHVNSENANCAIFDVSKRYRFTMQDVDTNEIIIIDEDTERKAFRKAFRFLGEKKVKDRELNIVSKADNVC